jgi:hypothetical protein
VVQKIINPIYDEKRRVIGGEGIQVLHFSGPMDVDKFISSGDDGGVSEIKVTIPVNYG